MTEAFICDAVRTPIGRYGGVLAPMRTDDLGAVPIAALMARHPRLDWAAAVHDVHRRRPGHRRDHRTRLKNTGHSS